MFSRNCDSTRAINHDKSSQSRASEVVSDKREGKHLLSPISRVYRHEDIKSWRVLASYDFHVMKILVGK
ncbi:uncharacterized protein PHALS_13554 [Plasmopara halstedii]|uniref:Uncharacterized protein n=1 Tax=Plasmopara halstedii TaxID=4781 RepID=A0A0P1AR35_PLAHL|nr:uncharacterized protein PHALS_13554 [Plasmopara halstedii]CEG43354.1 hypothetical protein PHALS_13554 [Plasmopara halstedii]|eukprot:XP_024579723.1 hypothetical protein PHALS_13554 [Plasmopara halstedii]